MNVQDLQTNSAAAASLLKVLSNRYRLMVLCELISGERSVTQLEAVVPLSQSALSQHLAKLRETGLVATRREAQVIYYSLEDARVACILGVMHELFCAPGTGKKGQPSKTRKSR